MASDGEDPTTATLFERAERLNHAACMALSYGPPSARSHLRICELAAAIAKAAELLEKRVATLEVS